MINLDENKLKKIFSSFQIPVKPEVLSDIQEIMASEDPSLVRVSEIIATDVGLSAAILKTINSPYFGMNRVISDIKQATLILGSQQVQSLVTALLLRRAFTGKSCISLERFWDNATDVANAMLFIGHEIKDKIPLENLYSIGLFHDCGIAAMSIKYPDYKETLIEANQSTAENLISIEERKYSTNHAVVGYFIATSWHLPKDICQIILQHHELDYLTNEKNISNSYTFATLKIAENMVEASRRHNHTFDWPKINEQCFELLGLTETTYKDFEEDYAESFL